MYGRKGLKSKTLGRAAVLSREIEEDLVKNLHTMEKHGFGLTRKELLETVGQYVSANNINNNFKNGVPPVKTGFFHLRKDMSCQLKSHSQSSMLANKHVTPILYTHTSIC